MKIWHLFLGFSLIANPYHLIGKTENNMELTSSAFTNQGDIPSVYTCEGQDINPPLAITGVPKEAKSLVLLMDDPDVPASVRKDQMWDHWVIFNIPPTTTSIKENTTPPGIQGKNTSGSSRYQGPCPPDRQHRYFFKLYALDQMLNLPPGASKKEVEHAMQGHILAECRLMGKYDKMSRKK